MPEDGKTDDRRGVSRRDVVKTLGGLGVAGVVGGLGGCARPEGAAAAAPRPRSARRPNIVFIMTDDHAANALSCYGSGRIDTPNLDRIAREGMRFDNCFVTNSLCAPSRATILTGKYSHLNGVPKNVYQDQEPFDNTQPTFPKMLRRAGYRTSMVGKWHLRSEPTGFDHWAILDTVGGQGRYFDPIFNEMGEKKQRDGYVTDRITDVTIDAIERYRREDEPFCVFSWHKAPHRGWKPDEEHADLWDDQNLPVPPTFNDDYANRASPASHQRMEVADMPDWRDEQPEGLSDEERKHWNYQRYMKRYLGTIASVDDNVGRLLDYLDEAGLAENTIVVYTSDNGFFLGEHGWFDKRFMYEESLRVPLLVRYPEEVASGAVNDDIVLNLDFAETFLDYAGAEVPADMQGASLRPLLRGEEPADWRDSMYYHYYEYPLSHSVREHYGVRTERYKLIHYYTIGEWELFDLRKDPNELNSVYDAPAYADVVEELTAELVRLRRRYGDTTGEPVAT